MRWIDRRASASTSARELGDRGANAIQTHMLHRSPDAGMRVSVAGAEAHELLADLSCKASPPSSPLTDCNLASNLEQRLAAEGRLVEVDNFKTSHSDRARLNDCCQRRPRNDQPGHQESVMAGRFGHAQFDHRQGHEPHRVSRRPVVLSQAVSALTVKWTACGLLILSLPAPRRGRRRPPGWAMYFMVQPSCCAACGAGLVLDEACVGAGVDPLLFAGEVAVS
jgi:hypothetical protein